MGNATIEPGDELVEAVDGHGMVVGIVSRRQMRERNLRHRCTYVALLTGAHVDDADGRLRFGVDAQVVVHLRADWKDIFPSRWDLGFGGVCGVGEPWRASAERELREEAGLGDVELVELGRAVYTDPKTSIVAMVYAAVVDTAVVDTIRASIVGADGQTDGEVVDVGLVAIDELAGWLADHSVCDDSVEIMVPMLGELRER